MQIKSKIYEQLSVRQRVIATIEAMSRSDDDELGMLYRTCPAKVYRQKDIAYSLCLDRALDMHVAHEHELLNLALTYMWLDSVDPTRFEKQKKGILQKMANIEGAWDLFTANLGITKDVMTKAGIFRNEFLTVLIEAAPEPNEIEMNRILLLMTKYVHE